MTIQYATLTEAEFDDVVAEWLRFANQRKQREVKKLNKEAEERGEIQD